ncbi:MAG: phosphoribosylformylglycinamidine synthase subunit PurS, partial [Anaerolineae bacterium]|nr:phosphoribosylformylglycinamidine synthase subunit PurS [Anaerolineae bacterium]
MRYRIEVLTRPDLLDARGESLCRQAAGLGIVGIETMRVSDLYFLEGDLDDATVGRLCEALLYDPVVEQAVVRPIDENEMRREDAAGAEHLHSALHSPHGCGEPAHVIEVALLPGVTDSVAESLLAGAAMIGVTGLTRAATGRRYLVAGQVQDDDLRRLAEGLLANVVIQCYVCL